MYAGAAGVVLEPTHGNRRGVILEALERLRAGGSTAGAAGIRLAYRIARENFESRGNNRVILATDGDFNVGVSSDADLVRLIEKERDDGIYLTVLGFGTGNLKDSKMEKLADHGNGAYHYIDGLLEAQRALVEQIGATLLTAAQDVKLQVEFNPERVDSYRLIGYENRLLAEEDFDNDRVDAGDMGAGHFVTALYEIRPTGRGRRLRYQKQIKPEAINSPELLFVKIRYKDPGEKASRLVQLPVMDADTGIEATSASFRLAAAAAEFGLLLRKSKNRGSADFDQVVELAKGSLGPDDDGRKAEFVFLARTAASLAKR